MKNERLEHEYWVYVVELDPTGLRVDTAGAVYVGETGKSPIERFVTHQQGGRTAARIVARAGKRLRPDLYPTEGPFATREEALKWEAITRDRLEQRGYRVFGGQGNPFMAALSRG